MHTLSRVGRRSVYYRRHRSMVHEDRRSHQLHHGADRSGQGAAAEGRGRVAGVPEESGDKWKRQGQRKVMRKILVLALSIAISSVLFAQAPGKGKGGGRAAPAVPGSEVG